MLLITLFIVVKCWSSRQCFSIVIYFYCILSVLSVYCLWRINFIIILLFPRSTDTGYGPGWWLVHVRLTRTVRVSAESKWLWDGLLTCAFTEHKSQLVAYVVVKLQQGCVRLCNVERKSLFCRVFDACHHLLASFGCHRPKWNARLWRNFQPRRLWKILSAFDGKLHSRSCTLIQIK